MPESLGRVSIQNPTVCTAAPCAVRHESPASGAVPRQFALRPTCGSQLPSSRQLPQVGRHSRSAMWPRFPPPEQAESLSMPSNQRFRFDHREELTPINQPEQRDQRQPCRVLGPPRLDLPLEVQRQLLAEEQILGGQLPACLQHRQCELGNVANEACRRRGENGFEPCGRMSRRRGSPSPSAIAKSRRPGRFRSRCSLHSECNRNSVGTDYFADHNGHPRPLWEE